MLKKMLFLAWLMLGGLAQAQEADQPEALEIPEPQRQVRTDLINGFNDRFSLFYFAEGSFDWLKSLSAFARANSSLNDDWEALDDLETMEQYSLVVYGPQAGAEDQWLVLIRYHHNNHKVHYDFDFAPEGDKMVLMAVREDEAPLEGKKLKEFLTDIFKHTAKMKN